MGRAQSSAQPTVTGFDGALGRRRGSGIEQLAASEPTAEALRQYERLRAQLRDGELSDTLRLLTSERERLARAPALRELAAELHFELFNVTRGWPGNETVLQAQQLLTDSRFRDQDFAETVLVADGEELHLWKTGAAHGPDALDRREDGLLARSSRDQLSGTPFGKTVCGQEVQSDDFARARRGAWLHSTRALHDGEIVSYPTCDQCAAQQHQFPECAEDRPAPLLSVAGDEPLRAAFLLDQKTPELLAHTLAEAQGEASLQARLAGNYRRVLCETVGKELTRAPALKLFHMLGADGPGVLRKLRDAQVKPGGLLDRSDWAALLSEHWSNVSDAQGHEQVRTAFRENLTRAMFAAASLQVRERRKAVAV